MECWLLPFEEYDLDHVIALLPVALRSRVRRLTLASLMGSGTWVSISEIGRESGLSPSQVVGAIRGSKGQYDPELSLMRLRLVSETISKIPGRRQQKTYMFNGKNQILLDHIERVLARYRKSGER